MTAPMTLKAVYLAAKQEPVLNGSVQGETQHLQLNASLGAEMAKLLEMRHAMMAIILMAKGVSKQTVSGTSLDGTAKEATLPTHPFVQRSVEMGFLSVLKPVTTT